jgi:hypothetical protein
MSANEADKLHALGLAVIQTESQAVAALGLMIHLYMPVCEGALSCMGKSGHIGSERRACPTHIFEIDVSSKGEILMARGDMVRRTHPTLANQGS